MLSALGKNFRLMLNHKPQYVIGFGGYPTVAVMLAAFILRKKIIIHEQNAIAGRVNKFFAKFANKIALTFETTKGFEKYSAKTIHTGLPL